MSELSDLARVQMFLADYAITDASHKLDAVGVGFQWSAVQAN